MGEGDREGGRGIWEGVDGDGGLFSTIAGPALRDVRFDTGLLSFVFALDGGFLVVGEGGVEPSSGAGVS